MIISENLKSFLTRGEISFLFLLLQTINRSVDAWPCSPQSPSVSSWAFLPPKVSFIEPNDVYIARIFRGGGGGTGGLLFRGVGGPRFFFHLVHIKHDFCEGGHLGSPGICGGMCTSSPPPHSYAPDLAEQKEHRI